MDCSNNAISAQSFHFDYAFADEPLLGQDDLNIVNLDSSNSLPIDTSSTDFIQENDQNQGKSNSEETKMVLPQSYIALPIINNISELNADAVYYTLSSTDFHDQNNTEPMISENLNCNAIDYQNKEQVLTVDSSDDKIKKNDCKICGRIAGKHTYYGAKTCQSCRAFFRRSVQRSYWRKDFAYSCNCEENCKETNEISCKIDIKIKNNCKYCRYLKCLQAGMLKKLVTMKKRGYNLRNKGKMNNLGNKKIKTSRMEDNNVYQIQPHQFSIACKQASTATKIIDIAQKYSKKSLFLNIGKFLEIPACKSSDDGLALITMFLKFEMVLTRQVYFTAMEFEEFMDLDHSMKVLLMEENNDALINLCKIGVMINHSKVESFDTSRNNFFEPFISKAWSSSKSLSYKMVKFESAKKRILEKAINLLKQDDRLFYFIFPVVLFSSNVKFKKELKAVIDNHAEHFMKLLTRYLHFTTNDDSQRVAISSGIIVDIVYHLKHWYDN